MPDGRVSFGRRPSGLGGNWTLTGSITMTGTGGANGTTGNDLFFSPLASASDTPVPEPSTDVLLSCGVAILIARKKHAAWMWR